MKAYLFVSGALFAVFAAMHFVIASEHWRGPSAAFGAGLGPAVIGICSAALAAWAFRLTRSAPGAQ